jgi:hypothetical protein
MPETTPWGALAAAGLLCLIWAGGYFFAGAFLPSLLGRGRLGAGFVLGCSLYVLISVLAGGVRPWPTAAATLAIGGACALVFRAATRRRPRASDDRFDVCDLLAIGVIAAFFAAFASRAIRWDDFFHFAYARQMQRGHFPPSEAGFPNVPTNYHYGWDVLLASVAQPGLLSLPAGSGMLSIFFVAAGAMLCLSLLAALGCSRRMRLAGTIMLFLGGGAHFLLFWWRGGRTFGGLSLSGMLWQHPWALGIGMILTLLAVVARWNGRPRSDLLWAMPLGTLPLLALPVLNGTIAPAVLLAIGLLWVWAMSRRPGWRPAGGYSLLLLAAIMAMYAGWRKVGGVMEAAGVHARAEFGFPWQSVPLRAYLWWTAQYIFLLAPLTLAAVVITVRGAARWRWAMFANPAMLVLAGFCVLLWPLPLFLGIRTFPIWDNYCKFTFVSVLSGWILLAWFMGRSAFLRRHPAVMAILVAAATLESFAHLASVLPVNEHALYASQARSQKELIRFVWDAVPPNETIAIVTDRPPGEGEDKKLGRIWDLRTAYRPEDRKDPLPDFKAVAMETGASILNYYDHYRFYSPEKERLLDDVAAGLCTGRLESLREWPIRYLLCLSSHEPPWMARWSADGHIRLRARGEAEDWRLYEVAAGVSP